MSKWIHRSSPLANRRWSTSPAPALAGAALLGLRPGEVAVVGDLPSDVEAAQRAGAVSVAALWGASDAGALDRASPEHTCRTVGELGRLLAQLAR